MGKRIWISVLLVLFILSGFLLFFSSKLQPRATSPTPTACQKAQRATKSLSDQNCEPRILVFSKTAAFRHESIPTAIAAIKRLASAHHVQVDASEDASLFTEENLARYNAVIFLMTTGHILNTQQQLAFEHYIHSGGGYVGVHSASDTEYAWSWYGRLVGAYFKSHPHITQASVLVEDPHHPSTIMLPTHWIRTDEWYNFATNPRPYVHVLLTVDEITYRGGTMGDHPIAWYHDFESGRSWYTAMGHTSASYQEPLFLAHLWGGITYAANLTRTS